MEEIEIIHCEDCMHCFESRRSITGYSCEVWWNEDFSCDVPLDGYCHKAKPKTYKIRQISSIIKEINNRQI